LNRSDGLGEGWKQFKADFPTLLRLLEVEQGLNVQCAVSAVGVAEAQPVFDKNPLIADSCDMWNLSKREFVAPLPPSLAPAITL